jgi:hypothetical protein
MRVITDEKYGSYGALCAQPEHRSPSVTHYG